MAFAAAALPFVARPLTNAVGRAADNPAKAAQTLMQAGCVVAGTAWVVCGIIGYMREQSGNIQPAAYVAAMPGGITPGSQGGGNGSTSSNGKVKALDKSGTVDQWIFDGYKLSGKFPNTESNRAKTKSLVQSESGGNPNAIGYKPTAYGYAKGLTQIVKPTWQTYAPKGYKDFDKYWSYPRINVATSLNIQKAQYGRVLSQGPY